MRPQVDMSTTRKYGGTGLGLNLVKQLVEAHGGAISLKSKLTVGTTFYFTLKVRPGAPPPEESFFSVLAQNGHTRQPQRPPQRSP